MSFAGKAAVLCIVIFQYKVDAQVTIGAVGFVSVASITVGAAVIGVGGITVKEGLTTTVLEEASTTLGMIKVELAISSFDLARPPTGWLP